MAKAEVDLSNLGEVIGAAVAQGIAAIAPRHEVKEGDPEYVARQQAEGWFDTFERPVYQNAYEAQARGIPADIRQKACRLRSGKYLKGRVTVEANENAVYLRYPVSGDAMMINQTRWSSFEDLIQKLWDEQQLTAVS